MDKILIKLVKTKQLSLARAPGMIGYAPPCIEVNILFLYLVLSIFWYQLANIFIRKE